MSLRHSPIRGAALRLAVFLVATAGVINCRGPGEGPAVTGDSIPSVLDALSGDTILTIARAQPYDSSPGVSDTATIVEGGRSAVLAFDPVVNGRSLPIDSLRNGRFVARWRRDGDSVRYPMRSARGYVWMDSLGGDGWRIRYYNDDPALGFTTGTAFAIEDSMQADSHPQHKSVADIEPADTVRVLHCYYTDSRWVCPRFDLLTYQRVQSAYAKRPN